MVSWVMDGLFTLWWVVVHLLWPWGWAASLFTVTVFVPLVLHHHFLSPLVCGSAGYYPQPDGKKDV